MSDVLNPISPDAYTGGGIKATMPTTFAFEEDPILKIGNEQASKSHEDRSMKVVQTLSKVIDPNATAEHRIAGANILKDESQPLPKVEQKGVPFEHQIPGDAPGSNEFRWSDLLGQPNSREAIKNYKGGADQRVEAFDNNGNRYFKVYNQRVSSSNPNGEFRRYEDEHFNPLTNKQIADAGIIASLRDIPLAQQNSYVNGGITAKAAAQNQAEYGNRTANIASAIAGGAPQLKANAIREKEITAALEPYSLSPKVQAVFAGIHSTVYGAQKDVKNASETLKRIASGTASSNEASDFFKKSGELGIDVLAKANYAEGKGTTLANGKKLSTEDVNSLSSAFSNAINQSAQVQSTKQDKLDQAILLEAKLDPKVIDQIREYKDLSFVDAKIQNDLERMGYSVLRPTVPHEQTNSYVYAGAKARQNELYADVASKYLKHATQSLTNGKAPAVGQVELLTNADPETQAITKSHYNNLAEFLKSKEQVYKNISEKPDTISSALSNAPAIPGEKPSAPAVEAKPSGSVAPTERKAAPPKKTSKVDLLNKLFPK
jgi:hypothetical protein